MRIPVDRRSDVPLYRQVADWLRREVRSGALPAGTRLPATRALADELGVSRITVVNAYAELDGDGLLVTREGSGTFVAPAATGLGRPAERDPASWPLWQRELPPVPFPAAELPDATLPASPTVPPLARRADVVSFTGVGDPRLFPVADLVRTIREVLARDGTAALDYGQPDGGHEPLRATVVGVLASQGVHTSASQVLVTSGSQQALALTCQVLLSPGDAVVVEEPTYDLALTLFRTLGLRIVGVPVDGDGMRVELLEPLLQQHHPRLVYTVPNFQNPSGRCLSTPRRRLLLALADRYNVPILEDDFVGDLRFEGRSQPAVKALDTAGQVVYVGTFSKMLMPGLRVGYLVADGPVLDALVAHKHAHDLTTSPLVQRVLDRYVTVGRYQAHLRRTTRLYRRRRDHLLTALDEQLPDVTVDPPTGGLFAWLELPDGVSARTLVAHAWREGVDVAPGTRFFPNPRDGDRFVRLNFATVTPDEITLGVARLRVSLDRALRGA